MRYSLVYQTLDSFDTTSRDVIPFSGGQKESRAKSRTTYSVFRSENGITRTALPYPSCARSPPSSGIWPHCFLSSPQRKRIIPGGPHTSKAAAASVGAGKKSRIASGFTRPTAKLRPSLNTWPGLVLFVMAGRCHDGHHPLIQVDWAVEAGANTGSGEAPAPASAPVAVAFAEVEVVAESEGEVSLSTR